MSRLIVEKTAIPGVSLLKPARFKDARGFFAESWNRRTMSVAGFDHNFVQDNHSLSHDTGTVRGLHCQTPPHAQDKLVRCGRGRLFDVAVDIRKDSPTFGQWFGTTLSAENGHQLLIPKGFLHGFATREPDTEIIYKCTDYYAPECERAVRFDDPKIGIDWGMGNLKPVLSAKDAAAPFLVAFDSPFIWEATP